jgi:hypothetical protein
MKTETRNRTLAAAVAVSLLAGSAAALAASDSNAESADSSDSSMTSDQNAVSTPKLSVEDQKVSDNTVVIDSVSMAEDGYVVIHAADDDGKLKAPESIGHKMVEKGEHNKVKIELDESVKSGDKLFAMLHKDTDEHGSYQFAESGGKKDGPATADGKPVIKPFMVK